MLDDTMLLLRSLEGRISVFLVLICASVLGLEISHERSERAFEISAHEVAAANLARSLARQAEDTIELANVAITGVVQRIEASANSKDAVQRLQNLVLREVADLPRVQGLFVFDRDGHWIAGSVQPNAVGIDIDPEFMRFHHGDRSLEAHVAVPQRDQSGGQWLMTVSRRFEQPDGSFAGVVVATIDLDYFEGIYGTFDIGRGGSIALFRSDGVVLARHPYDPSYIGRDVSGTALFKEMLPSRDGGAYRMVSPLDGVERIAGFHVGRRFPVGVIVATSKDEALTNWRATAAKRLSTAVALVALIAGLGALVIRAIRRQQAGRAALIDSEQNFRLLAENSSDVVTRVAQDGTRLYVSPAAEQVLGCTPSSLVGTSILEAVEMEDAKAFRDAVARLQAGMDEFATLSYRRKRPDGTIVWLESAIRIAHDPRTGLPDGGVVVSRDVTHRKVLEAELANLARTDALTGLANRRHFDERLRQEWAHAAETGLPISLILFDLDNFKGYNDTYGHQAGDDSLLRVAAEMKAHAHRPSDVAARYGGEELALLLPATDLDGATVLAERIRAGVAGLAIRHRANEPSGIVTMSAGVASMTVANGLVVLPERLLGRADRALYAAKREGRDRVIAADDATSDVSRAA